MGSALEKELLMIKVTRLNDSEVIINADLIEHIEPGVDTVISLTNGTSFVVKESWQEVVERIVAFKQRVAGGPLPLVTAPT